MFFFIVIKLRLIMSYNDIIVVQVILLGCGGVGILCIFGLKVCDVV